MNRSDTVPHLPPLLVLQNAIARLHQNRKKKQVAPGMYRPFVLSQTWQNELFLSCKKELMYCSQCLDFEFEKEVG